MTALRRPFERFFSFAPRTPAEALLIAANLVPLAGAAFFGWSAGDIMIVFWLENLIIGLLNVVKMLLCPLTARRPAMILPAVLLAAFFTVHYGMFTAVHGMFVVQFFANGAALGVHSPLDALTFALERPESLMGAAGLLLSHFFSLVYYFIIKGEGRETTPAKLMTAPYARVVILHVTIIFGGMLAMATGEARWALVLLTLLKILVDMTMHRRSHNAGKIPAET